MPFMAFAYLAIALFVVVMNYEKVPDAISLIFKSASVYKKRLQVA